MSSSFAAASPAATQSVSAPSAIGFAWDASDHTLRPILGVVGASRIGSNVAPGTSYVAGAASAVTEVALFVRANGTVDRMVLPATTATTLPGVTAASNSGIRFSPSGTAALLFSPGSTTMTLLTNMAAAPRATNLLATSAVLDAAVSDKGTVAVLQMTGKGAQLAVVSQSGSQAVSSLNGLGAVSFVGKGEDLALADTAGNTVSVVHNLSTTPAVNAVPTANLLAAPVAVGAAISGRWLVVANGDSSVTRIDLNGQVAPERIPCPAQPTTVGQLAGDASFLFSSIGTAPAWLSDMSAQSPAMLFVPALASGS